MTWQAVRQAVGLWIAGSGAVTPVQQALLPASFGGDPTMAGFRRFAGSNGQSALRDLPMPTHERFQLPEARQLLAGKLSLFGVGRKSPKPILFERPFEDEIKGFVRGPAIDGALDLWQPPPLSKRMFKLAINLRELQGG